MIKFEDLDLLNYFDLSKIDALCETFKDNLIEDSYFRSKYYEIMKLRHEKVLYLNRFPSLCSK